jgi:hypothetical protein
MAMSHFLIIVSLLILFKINQNDDARQYIFNATLLTALAITMNPALQPLLIYPLLVLLNSRVFIFREFVLYLLGLLLPMIYLTAYLYFHPYILVGLSEKWGVFGFSYSPNFFFWLFVFFIFISMLFSFIVIRKKINSSSIRFKLINRMVWFLLPFSVVSDVICLLKDEPISLVSALPLSIIISMSGLALRKTLFFNIVLLFLWGTVLCIHWMA